MHFSNKQLLRNKVKIYFVSVSFIFVSLAVGLAGGTFVKGNYFNPDHKKYADLLIENIGELKWELVFFIVILPMILVVFRESIIDLFKKFKNR